MAIYRVNKNENYTVVSNTHLKDKTLSLKAKGLLTMMLSLPDDWRYSINGLVSICKESVTAVENAVRELKEHKYIKITKSKNEQGKFVYIYDVFENPQTDNPETDNPGVENPGAENPGVDNLGVENPEVENLPLYKDTKELNTNKQNTKELNTNKQNTKELNTNYTNYQQIVDMYNETCVSFPAVRSLSEARKRAIRARLKSYKLEGIQEAFIKAEDSDFLKGANDRNWSAKFDWIMNDANMAKILDGNYDNKTKQPKKDSMGTSFMDLDF